MPHSQGYYPIIGTNKTILFFLQFYECDKQTLSLYKFVIKYTHNIQQSLQQQLELKFIHFTLDFDIYDNSITIVQQHILPM